MSASTGTIITYAAHLHSGDWWHPLGQSASSFLAVALSFRTGWMGENHFAPVPSALYGGVLLAAAFAYLILQQTMIASQGSDSPLKAAIGGDWKGKLSPVLYLCAIISTFLSLWVAQALYVVTAILWLVLDRRIEKSLHGDRA